MRGQGPPPDSSNLLLSREVTPALPFRRPVSTLWRGLARPSWQRTAGRDRQKSRPCTKRGRTPAKSGEKPRRSSAPSRARPIRSLLGPVAPEKPHVKGLDCGVNALLPTARTWRALQPAESFLGEGAAPGARVSKSGRACAHSMQRTCTRLGEARENIGLAELFRVCVVANRPPGCWPSPRAGFHALSPRGGHTRLWRTNHHGVWPAGLACAPSFPLVCEPRWHNRLIGPRPLPPHTSGLSNA